MNLFQRALSMKQIVTHAPQVTTRQVSMRMDLSQILQVAGKLKSTDALNDTDGKQIFILGFTPMDASVRVGRLSP